MLTISGTTFPECKRIIMMRMHMGDFTRLLSDNFVIDGHARARFPLISWLTAT